MKVINDIILSQYRHLQFTCWWYLESVGRVPIAGKEANRNLNYLYLIKN